MQCPACGAQLAEAHIEDGRCPNCGANVKTPLSVPSAQPPGAPVRPFGRNDMEVTGGVAEPLQAGGTRFPPGAAPRGPTGNVFSRFFHSLGGLLGLGGHTANATSSRADAAAACPECGGSMRNGTCQDCGYNDGNGDGSGRNGRGGGGKGGRKGRGGKGSDCPTSNQDCDEECEDDLYSEECEECEEGVGNARHCPGCNMVVSPSATKCPHCGEAVENAAPFQSRHVETGQFLPTKGSSPRQTGAAAAAGHAAGQPQGGTSGQPEDVGSISSPDEAIEEEAAKRGMSADELKSQLGLPTGKGPAHNCYWDWTPIHNVFVLRSPAGAAVANEEGNHCYVVNPFVSEQQRRYLWVHEPEIAHAWAHGQHTGGGARHTMPATTGKDVAGPLAAAERKAQKKKGKGKKPKAAEAATGNARIANQDEEDGEEDGEGEGEEVTNADFRQWRRQLVTIARRSSMTDFEAEWWSRMPPPALSRLITANCGGPGSKVPGPCKGGAVSRAAAAASGKANDYNSHADAVQAHSTAAQTHEAHAKAAREAGNEKVAAAHDKLAAAHRDRQSEHARAAEAHGGVDFDLGDHGDHGAGDHGGEGIDLVKDSGHADTPQGHDAFWAGVKADSPHHAVDADTQHAAGKAHWAAMKSTDDKTEKAFHQGEAKRYFDRAKQLGGGKKSKPTGNRGRVTNRGAVRMSRFNRDTTIEFLVTNCSCWENSRDQLEAMSNGQLRFLAGMARNAKAEGSNADTVDGGPGDLRAGGVEGENYDPSESSSDYQDDDDDFPEKAQRGVPAKRNPASATPTGNLSLVDMLRRSDHPEDQAAVANIEYAGRLVAEKRQALIQRLTSRIEDPRLRRAMVQNYAAKSTDELELFARTLPSEASAGRPPRPLFSGVGARDPLYFGGSGGAIFNRQTPEDRADFLDLPRMEYGKEADAASG